MGRSWAALSAFALLLARVAYGAVDAVEAELLGEHDRVQQLIVERGFVYTEDRELTAYLESIGRRLVSRLPTPHASYRFLVLRNPEASAAALANGTVLLLLGILEATEDEAQLANVIAHEIIHTARHHQLAGYRDTRSKVLIAKVTDLLSGGLATPFVVPSIASAISGYNREQESEADREGLRLIWSGGYSAAAGMRSLSNLEEPPAPRMPTEPYREHPTLRDREAALRALLPTFNPPASSGEVGLERHRRATLRASRATIELALQQRQYRLALRQTARQTARRGEDAWLAYAVGEAHRLIADDPDGAAYDEATDTGAASAMALVPGYRAKTAAERATAKEAYERALRLDPYLLVARRGLGLLARSSGDYATATRELTAYLTIGAQPSDRRTIERILKEIHP